MIKACIFDMDGTVADTLTTIAYFANAALDHFGLPTIDKEKYKLMVGDGASVLVRRMMDEVGAPDELYDRVRTYYNSTYDSNFLYLTEPYDGILPMLRELKRAGIRTAIVSNKPESTACKISEKLFGDLIERCRGGRAGVPLKPNPQAVLETLAELGVGPDECLYIGDTAVDMETGKRAGIYSIGVLWGFRDEKELCEAHADMIVSSPTEIISIALGGEERE
ncbi:MAG: HAD family hydrolase [Lachnospiraceae bacterium]|nr:HAD family hydrolase [Lachnospiraceae bacterium]